MRDGGLIPEEVRVGSRWAASTSFFGDGSERFEGKFIISSQEYRYHPEPPGSEYIVSYRSRTSTIQS